jgi:hypothetical protein
MSQFAEALRLLKTSPAASLADDDFVARVMRACAEPPRALPQPRRRPAFVVYATTTLAVAAVIALLATRPSAPGNDLAARGGSVAARGAGARATTVQAFVGRSLPGVAPALLEGAELGPGDGILVRYSTPSDRPAFLMVFALDELGDVHWIHPAYLHESDSPTSLELERGATLRVLDEVAEPENPAPGPLRVYALLSDAPLRVKEVEAKLATSRSPVHESFPEVEVEEWRCTWRAH